MEWGSQVGGGVNVVGNEDEGRTARSHPPGGAMNGGVVLGNEEEGIMADTLLRRRQDRAALPLRSRTPRRRRRQQLSSAAALVAGISVLTLSATQRPADPEYQALGCYRDADMGGGARVIPS